MKTTILLLLFVFVTCIQLLADDASPPPNQHHMGANEIKKIVRLDGVQYQTLPDLQAAIERLPAGSTLRWDWGCTWFRSIPLGEQPPMTIEAFKQFCTDHGVELHYGNYSGW